MTYPDQDGFGFREFSYTKDQIRTLIVFFLSNHGHVLETFEFARSIWPEDSWGNAGFVVYLIENIQKAARELQLELDGHLTVEGDAFTELILAKIWPLGAIGANQMRQLECKGNR